jgi:hypothetical protein
VTTVDSSVPDWPDDDFALHVSELAADVAQLLSDEPRWVHRRVETVTFHDDVSLRRRTSVDFTVPNFLKSQHTRTGGVIYVPLSLLEKRILEDFDLRDESGAALPMVSRAMNSRLSGEILIQQAVEALRAQSLPTELHEANRTSLMALAGPTQTDDALDSDAPEAIAQAKLIVSDEIARGFIQELGANFVLLAPIRATPGDHRVVKFAYDAEYFSHSELPAGEEGASLTRRVYERCKVKARNALEVFGIAPFSTGFLVLALADTQSYHVEVSGPDEVGMETWLMRFGTEQEPTLLDSSNGSRRVHLHGGSDNPPNSWGLVGVEFFLRPGVVWPVCLLSGITTATLAVGLMAHLWWDLPRSGDAAAALIVALPTFFAPAVAPGSHRLVRRMFKGLRSLVFVSALISFVAAASLALNLRHDAYLNTSKVWSFLAILSLIVTLATSAAFVASYVKQRR